MTVWRLYLLGGLIVHKLVWEMLKRRSSPMSEPAQPTAHRATQSLSLWLVKAVKVGILLGVIAQTFAPEIFPLSSDPQIVMLFRGVGLTIYTAGLLIAIASRLSLGSNWSDIETGQVLSEQTVVSRGIYRFIRHPIYLGDLLLLFGLELSLNSLLVLGVFLLAPVVMWKAVREEKMLVTELPGYDLYCARTKRFIPFVV